MIILHIIIGQRPSHHWARIYLRPRRHKRNHSILSTIMRLNIINVTMMITASCVGESGSETLRHRWTLGEV